MKRFEERAYRIPLKGLKNKIHHFEYYLDKKFFDEIENSLIQDCDIKVAVTFDKSKEPYVIEFDINGTFKADCDKCTAHIDVPIAGSYKIYVEYSSRIENDENNDEVMFIDRDAENISLIEVISDFVIISLPIINSCDDPYKTDYCDKTVLKYIQQQQEETDSKIENKSDPRWDQLKKLK